jgi:glucose-6-phosphate-specific signal transduction histidine kinase
VDAKLPPRVEDDAYSIVREGLTNAIKHAPGAHVTGRLALHESELQIEVSDDGPRTSGALRDTGGGLGLLGMRDYRSAVIAWLDPEHQVAVVEGVKPISRPADQNSHAVRRFLRADDAHVGRSHA